MFGRVVSLQRSVLPCARFASSNSRVPANAAVSTSEDPFIKSYRQALLDPKSRHKESVTQATDSERLAKPTRSRIVDELGRAYGTGKRKSSIARVWVRPGEGEVVVNNKALPDFMPRISRRKDVIQPLIVTGLLGKISVMAFVKGGGQTGQAQAVRHGIAKALQNYNPVLRPALRKEGLLVRDPRVVERKKPGQKKARKKFQWVKR